jgi:hypothetical protein
MKVVLEWNKTPWKPLFLYWVLILTQMKGIVADILSPMKTTCKINYKDIRVWGRSIDHGWIHVNPWWVCDPIFAEN